MQFITNFFKRPNFITDQLYKVDSVKSEIEHREPITVGFFILEYAKLRMLELYFNFFTKFCDTEKYDKREPGLFREEFMCSEMLRLSSKTYCCYDQKRNKYKNSSKGLNKRTLEDCGDGPMSKYRKSVGRSSQRHFNQQRIPNNEA